MRAFSFLRRRELLPSLAVATVTGLVVLLASATPFWAAESKKTKDTDRAAPKDSQPSAKPVSSEAEPGDEIGRPKPPRDNDRRQPKPPRPDGSPGEPNAGPRDDFGPPGPPRDNDRRRSKPPRPQGQPGTPDERQPGQLVGPPLGPDGQPRRPGPFGPGPQPGGPPRGPQDWASLEKSDPEMYKLMKAESDLDRRTQEVAEQYRQAAKGERDKIKQELKKLVTQQFENRQERRKLELNHLEEELKRLRDGMDRREKGRDQLIDKRVAELAGEETEPGF
jgi:hypothetical protein